MRKLLVYSVSIMLFLEGSNAFAQFNKLSQGAKNRKRFEADVMRQAMEHSWQVRVPVEFVPSGQVTVSSVSFPQKITPVTTVFAEKVLAGYSEPITNVHLLNTVGSQLAQQEGMRFIIGEHAVGKAFYEDASELARNLDEYYKGKAEEWVGPDGRVVKFYALPVDGILYKPAEYQVPVVLHANDYFVIYDVQTQTGKIVDNIAQVYDGFMTRIQYERKLQDEKAIQQAISQAESQPVGSVSYKSKKEIASKYRATDHWTETWYILGLPYSFDSMSQLGQALQIFYEGKTFGTKVGMKGQKHDSYIFEIPIKGLSYTDVHGDRHEINGDNQLFWYLDEHYGCLISRSDFEENTLFEFIE